MNWKCKKCGSCCVVIGCKLLDTESKLCTVYDTRPDACRVQDDGIDRTPFCDICNTLLIINK